MAHRNAEGTGPLPLIRRIERGVAPTGAAPGAARAPQPDASAPARTSTPSAPPDAAAVVAQSILYQVHQDLVVGGAQKQQAAADFAQALLAKVHTDFVRPSTVPPPQYDLPDEE